MKIIRDVYAIVKKIADLHNNAGQFSPSNSVVDYFKLLDILNSNTVNALPEYDWVEKLKDQIREEFRTRGITIDNNNLVSVANVIDIIVNMPHIVADTAVLEDMERPGAEPQPDNQIVKDTHEKQVDKLYERIAEIEAKLDDMKNIPDNKNARIRHMCSICGLPIYREMIMMGDLSSNEYAHPDCYYRNEVQIKEKRIADLEEKFKGRKDKNCDINEKKMDELNHEISELTKEIGRLEGRLGSQHIDNEELRATLSNREQIIEKLKSHLLDYEDDGMISVSAAEKARSRIDEQPNPVINNKTYHELIKRHRVYDIIDSLTLYHKIDKIDPDTDPVNQKELSTPKSFYCKCGWSGDDIENSPKIPGSYTCPRCGEPVYNRIKFKNKIGKKFEWGGKVWQYSRFGDPDPNEWIVIENNNGGVNAVIRPSSISDKYHSCWIVKPVVIEEFKL
ncbi:MAG: hypothetical protein JXB48_06170 [Candidatus Latescibacteria bacterium]|nr:hypothetical protein [Candidatus Latescibacterota bacterium]